MILWLLIWVHGSTLKHCRKIKFSNYVHQTLICTQLWRVLHLKLSDFISCSKSFNTWCGVCIWILEHCRKTIFRTYLPHNEVEIRYPNSCDIWHKHYIFEYCLAQVILDNVDVSCSEDGNVYRPFLKSKTTTKKKISSYIFMHLSNHIWYQPGMWWGILAPNVKYQNKNEQILEYKSLN